MKEAPAKGLDEKALQIIEETHVAGKETRHNRAANLHAIQELVEGMPNATFGITGVDRFSAQEVLDAVSGITGCSSDIEVTTGGGYISRNKALKGIKEQAALIHGTAVRHGRFVIGTGHPGSLIAYYIALGKLIRRWGGQILEVAAGTLIPPIYDLDYVEGVAVLSDRASLWHTHDTKPMEAILAQAGKVDLAVVDHGFGGAAINGHIPAVVIIDTNDPAPAVAKVKMGADVLVIPMDDNRPISCYLPIVDLVRQYGELEIGRSTENTEDLRDLTPPPGLSYGESEASAEGPLEDPRGGDGE